MNVAVYGFTLASARLLDVHDLGALTALLAILLVGNVVPLSLQASTARRLATDGEHRTAAAASQRPDFIRTAARTAWLLSTATAILVASVTAALSGPLQLDSVWPAIWCGATVLPLGLMGAQMGIAQGTERWHTLTAVYLVGGLGRLLGGVGALMIEPSVTSAMAGVLVGGWLPVVVFARVLRAPGVAHANPAHAPANSPFIRETLLAAQALLAYFVLSNLDAVVARTLLNPTQSGLYAAGVILAKAALFFPQFVSVVVYPALARDTTARARLIAAGCVAGLGVLATAATAVLPGLALVLVGGEAYADLANRLWLFALAGSCLAVVHLLVFDAIARHAHGVTAVVWAAVAVLLAIAYLGQVGLVGLIVSVAAVATVLAIALAVLPTRFGGGRSAARAESEGEISAVGIVPAAVQQ